MEIEPTVKKMEKNFGFIKSDLDGAEIAFTEITSDTPSFALQILHGMAEHRARYYSFMEYIASAGGACIAADMRGHGESAGKENYGYFGEDSVNAVLSDVQQTGDILRRKYPDIPFILLGHSMGSLVARAYTAGHDEQLSGLILTGEASYNPAVNGGLIAAHLLALFRGDRYRSSFMDRLVTGAFQRGFVPEEGDGGQFLWLSADPSNRQAYAADPACGFVFTVNGYITLFSLMKYAFAPKNWNVRRREMPVYFLSGEDDPVMGNKKRFQHAVRFMSDMGYKNVFSKLYPGMRHEILNEAERETVYSDILRFITNETEENVFPL